jgi:hypothetical protein
MQQDFLLIEQEFLENLLKPTVKKVLRAETKQTESLKANLAYEISKLVPYWHTRLMPTHSKLKAAFSHRYEEKKTESKDKRPSHLDNPAYKKAIEVLLGEEGETVLTTYLNNEQELTLTAKNLKSIESLKTTRNDLLIKEYLLGSIVLPLLRERLQKSEGEKETKSNLDMPTLATAVDDATEKRLRQVWGAQTTQQSSSTTPLSSTPKRTFKIPNCHLSPEEQVAAIKTLKEIYKNSIQKKPTDEEALQYVMTDYESAKSAIRKHNSDISDLQQRSVILKKIKQRFEKTYDERSQLANNVEKYSLYRFHLSQQLTEKTANTRLAFIQDNDAESFEKLKAIVSKNTDNVDSLFTEPPEPQRNSEDTEELTGKPHPQTSRLEDFIQYISKHRYKILLGLSLALTIINTILIATGVLAPLGIALEGFNQLFAGHVSINFAISYGISIGASWTGYGLKKAFSALIEGIIGFCSAIASCVKSVIAWCKGDAVAELQAHTGDFQHDPEHSLSRDTTYSVIEDPRHSVSHSDTRTPSSSVTDRQRGSSAPPPAPMIQTEGPTVPSISTSIPASEGTTSRSTTADLLGNRFIPNADPVPGNTALGEDLLSSTPALPTPMNSLEQGTSSTSSPEQSVMKTQTQAEEVTLTM